MFLGKTSNSSQSVWLSVTTAGSFNLEAQGNQLIDSWSMSSRGLHLSTSPIVSQGNGGTHFLINSVNNQTLDSQNQKGGIVFPPLPEEPPSVMPPIVLVPEHPIVIPPGSPPTGSQPIPPGSLPPGSIQTPGELPNLAPSQTSNQSPLDQQASNQVAPITRGRQFVQENPWNIWSDNYYFTSNDGRNNLDAKGITTDFSIGADRRVLSDLTLGALLSFIQYHYNAFDGGLKNQAHGFNIGPYVGYRILPKWSIEGTITYGQMQNNNDIASLNSQFRTQVFHADLHSTGIYQFGHFQLRPKPLISFTHYRNPSYELNGSAGNIAFQVNRAQESFNFDYAEFRLEGNYTLETKKGNLVQTYAEPGIDYAFSRPNDGQVLTGNLNLATTNPVTETITVGIRTLLSTVFLIDASGSYLSFGQQGLSVWELRLLAAYSFG